MKIAYINLVYSRDNMLGVEKKLLAEANYFVKHGFDVYFLNRHRDGFYDNVHFKKVDNYHDKRFFELYLRAFTFKVIENIVDIDSYDKIYLRYPLMDFSALSFSKKYGKKIVTQHHGKELEEIKNYKIKLPFKIFQYLCEYLLAKRFYKEIYGLTAISDDMVAYEVRRLNFNRKNLRFSNGINPESFSTFLAPTLDKEFHILMMASSFATWHGLDRLLHSLTVYHDSAMIICLHIVGKVDNNFSHLLDMCQKNSSIRIYTHGKLYDRELDAVFKKIHMACDSLAMYRLDMKEASTLKSKEYIARGIPFLYSAPDLDLQGLSPFLYQVENSNTLIDFYKILRFYKKLDIVEMQKEMQITTNTILSWDKKIEKLKERMFCEKK